MSAADWTRIQRRKAGATYASQVSGTGAARDKDISPTTPAQIPAGTALLIPRFAGKPKTLRPASEWTNYVASQVTDYKLYSSGSGGANETSLNQNAITTNLVRLCKACAGQVSVTNMRTTGQKGVCSKCATGVTHVRLS